MSIVMKYALDVTCTLGFKNYFGHAKETFLRVSVENNPRQLHDLVFSSATKISVT